MFYFDIYQFILVLPAMMIAGWAQAKVSSTFKKYSKVYSRRNMTGADVARAILQENGLYHITVGQIAGNLTDHYDPSGKIIRLSDSVYGSTSLAAIGVAAHEAGHAVQHARNYAPLTIRNAIIPVTNIGSKLSMPLILLGIVFSYEPLISVGILAFSLMVIFQLVTLPVEFNASNRAIAILGNSGLLDSDELPGAKKVLSAAAMTYVAALIVAAAQLLRLVLLFGGRRRD